MTKRRWKGYMKSFGSHIDPEKEEQLKWSRIGKHSCPGRPQFLQCYWRVWDSSIESKRLQFKAHLPPQYYPECGILWYTERQWALKTERKVRRILKLIKSIHLGSKEGNSKKTSELIQLTNDFHKQYESLYALDHNLRGEIRKRVHVLDEGESYYSTSSSDTELHYSQEELNQTGESRSDIHKVIHNDHRKQNALDMEDVVLKDKLTSASEVKESIAFNLPSSFSQVPESREVIKDPGVEAEESEGERQKLVVECAWLKRKLIEKEDDLLSLTKKHQISERERLSRIHQLEGQVANLKLEMEGRRTQKMEFEEQVRFQSDETKELEQEISGLRDRINGLKENLPWYENKVMEENKGLKVQVRHLEKEVNSLCEQKSNLQKQVKSMNLEACHLRVEKEELPGNISKLERRLTETEAMLCIIRKEYEAHKNDTSRRIISFQAQISDLQRELEMLQAEKGKLQLQFESEEPEALQRSTEMETRNVELTNKVADLQGTVIDLENVVKKLEEENKQVQGQLIESKSNFQAGERKIEQMAEEFGKQFEDNLIVWRNRIRVAEKLQVENKEFSWKNRTVHEHQNKDLKKRVQKYEAGLINIKDVSLTTNNILATLDTVALKFGEFTANFENRISKASRELKSANDWVRQKNKAASHVKEDLDCLLAKLHKKEAEMSTFREEARKSGNRVRKLEEMIKDKEDYMFGLEEEKREAIRQLCVWIDYHRSRSDYYRKTLTEVTVGCKWTAY